MHIIYRSVLHELQLYKNNSFYPLNFFSINSFVKFFNFILLSSFNFSFLKIIIFFFLSKMPFTQKDVSFFVNIITFLNKLESDRLQVLFGHSELFRKWLDVKCENIVGSENFVKFV